MNEKTINELTTRIESLESQLAFQEGTIEQLNDQITKMNLQFSVVNRQVELLAQKLTENKGSNIASMAEEVPPPHY